MAMADSLENNALFVIKQEKRILTRPPHIMTQAVQLQNYGQEIKRAS